MPVLSLAQFDPYYGVFRARHALLLCHAVMPWPRRHATPRSTSGGCDQKLANQFTSYTKYSYSICGPVACSTVDIRNSTELQDGPRRARSRQAPNLAAYRSADKEQYNWLAAGTDSVALSSLFRLLLGRVWGAWLALFFFFSTPLHPPPSLCQVLFSLSPPPFFLSFFLLTFAFLSILNSTKGRLSFFFF